MIRAREEARSITVLLVALTVVLSERSGGAVPAGTKPRPRVVLLGATADDPLAGRLAAELEALGLAVTRSTMVPTIAVEEQVQTALATGARAAVVAHGRRTEFWIPDEGGRSDRVVLRQELEIESSPGMESVLSLRTVELLRVSLGLATGAELQSPPLAGPPVAPERPVRAQRFSLGIASGIFASTGRLGPFATLGAELRARLLGAIGLELDGYFPLGTQTIVAADGQVETSVWLAGGGLLFAPGSGRRFSAEVGAGLLAVVVRGVGSALPPASGSTDEAVGLACYGRGGARFRLGPGWSLRLDMMGGSTALRRPVITARNTTSGNTDLTAWGTGFVAGLGGVEATF